MNKDNIELIQSVFKSENGKNVLNLMQNMAFFNHSTFSPESSHVTSLNEGQRRFMLRLTKIVNTDINRVEQKAVQAPELFFK